MIVAGGYYRELCERPSWNGVFGSGGRAVTSLVGLTPHLEFHTYCQQERLTTLEAMEEQGVSLHVCPSRDGITFAYLHPLSFPGISPKTSTINREDPIRCRGAVILRFGFLEGHAIVHGDRVIFDPQSNFGATSFRANGSSAKCLALVLNEHELKASMPGDTLSDSIHALLVREHADVAVIKCGPNGVAVLEKGRRLTEVPAFRTPHVFKLGSGDVFSAAFAHYWGVEERPVVDAAVLASRSTAAYCSSQCLPIPAEKFLPAFPPATADKRKDVCIIGSTDTLANHWLIEESKWCISQLGRSTSILNAAGNGFENVPCRSGAIFLLADTLQDRGVRWIELATASGLPVVVLREREIVEEAWEFEGAELANDFTTALYWAAWT